MEMTLSVGVATLLANAKNKIPSGAYLFKGDLHQMATAMKVAQNLGLEYGTGGGYSFVYSQRDYDKVVNYLIEHKLSGCHHYEEGKRPSPHL